MLSMDEVKQQFVQQVKLRGYDDQYIDKKEEKEILQIALQNNITLESARAALAQVCEREGYVLESAALGAVMDMLKVQVANDGKLDEKEFNDAVAMLKMKTKGKKNDQAVKKMIVEIIDENSYKVKTGFFSNWYTRVKREVGVA